MVRTGESGTGWALLTEERLIARAPGGDQPAFAELVRRHGASAWYLGLVVTGSPTAATEAAGRGLMRTMATLDPSRWTSPEPYRAWLLRSVHAAAMGGRPGSAPDLIDLTDRIDEGMGPGPGRHGLRIAPREAARRALDGRGRGAVGRRGRTRPRSRGARCGPHPGAGPRGLRRQRRIVAGRAALRRTCRARSPPSPFRCPPTLEEDALGRWRTWVALSRAPEAAGQAPGAPLRMAWTQVRDDGLGARVAAAAAIVVFLLGAVGAALVGSQGQETTDTPAGRAGRSPDERRHRRRARHHGRGRRRPPPRRRRARRRSRHRRPRPARAATAPGHDRHHPPRRRPREPPPGHHGPAAHRRPAGAAAARPPPGLDATTHHDHRPRPTTTEPPPPPRPSRPPPPRPSRPTTTTTEPTHHHRLDAPLRPPADLPVASERPVSARPPDLGAAGAVLDPPALRLELVAEGVGGGPVLGGPGLVAAPGQLGDLGGHLVGVGPQLEPDRAADLADRGGERRRRASSPASRSEFARRTRSKSRPIDRGRVEVVVHGLAEARRWPPGRARPARSRRAAGERVEPLERRHRVGHRVSFTSIGDAVVRPQHEQPVRRAGRPGRSGR